MLESILNSGNGNLTLTIGNLLICSLISVVLGVVIAACYMHCSEKYSKSFVVTLVILPVLVQAVITMVNGNLGTGVAIVGAFSLVRFRSIPGNAKEIGSVFFTMAVGLATGMGYIGYAAILTVMVSAVMIILAKTGFGVKKSTDKQLKITIPENLNYTDLFDDIFKKYLCEYKLLKAKTTNLGSMFELTYSIRLADEQKEKEMIDEIRVRNGNLTVLCGQVSALSEEL
ncbi:MAG: DUF4956 domain-containing protein [Lachnospiraceae bacterium]|nr:DUF4956 domain-containing protein [Lachnospiraceae bacterium]